MIDQTPLLAAVLTMAERSLWRALVVLVLLLAVVVGALAGIGVFELTR